MPPPPPSPPPFPPPTTQELQDWDRQYLWHPFTPMKPWVEGKEIVVIGRGEGEWLIDTEGRRYLDGSSSLWCNVHGHNVPELNAAVEGQLHQISHSTLLGLTNVPAVVLAKRLVELARSCGLGLDKVFYSDDGSTAVEVACKIAYQHWHNLGQERGRFIALENAYHGDTLGAVSLGGISLFHGAFKGLCFQVDFAPVPRGDGGEFLAAVEALLVQYPQQVAAIVIEPLVLGAGGMLMYPPTVLVRLRELADRYGTLLVFDEVLTGFGRTGTMFAAQQAGEGGVTPDLLCLSKGLTAGYMPLGATLVRQSIYDSFYADPREGKTLFHGHTFTGHPLACAVALASLDLFAKNRLLEHIAVLGDVMEDILGRARGVPGAANVRRVGMIGAMDLVDAESGGMYPYYWRVGGEVCKRLRGKGILLRPLGDTLVVMPVLAISAENLRYLCASVVESLGWMPEIVAQKRREFSP